MCHPVQNLYPIPMTDPTARQGADEVGSGADGHGGDEQDGRLDVQAQVAAEPGQGEGGRAGRGRQGARGGRGEEKAQGGGGAVYMFVVLASFGDNNLKYP